VVALLVAPLLLPSPTLANEAPQVSASRSFQFELGELPAEIYLDLLAYASDADGDELLCTQPSASAGTVTQAPSALGGAGQCTYLFRPGDPASFSSATVSYTVIDGRGGSASGQILITHGVPIAPAPLVLYLAAAPLDYQSIEISWYDIYDDQASYDLLRRLQGQGINDWEQVGARQLPPFESRLVAVDQGLQPETEYEYVVDACLVDGCVRSELASATTLSPPPSLAKDDEIDAFLYSTRLIPEQELLLNDDDSNGPLTIIGWEPNVGNSTNPPQLLWLQSQRSFVLRHFTGNTTAPYRFRYEVAGGDSTATAEVKVTFQPGAPVTAQDDLCPSNCLQTQRGLALHIPFSNFLANDLPAAGPKYVMPSFFSRPENGRLELIGSPIALWYVPNDGFVGVDTFYYTIRGASSQTPGSSARVEVEVVGPPLSLNFRDDSVDLVLPESPPADVPISFSELLLNDHGEGRSIAKVCDLPSQVCLSGESCLTLLGGECPENPPDPVHGALVYRSTAPTSGSDEFHYRATDGIATSGQAKVTVRRLTAASICPALVSPGSEAACHVRAVNDLLHVPSGEPLAVHWEADLLANDVYPPDLQALEYIDFVSMGRPLYGSLRNVGVSFVGFVYVAPQNFEGVDRFAYTLQEAPDSPWYNSIGQVVVLVEPGAPVADDDTAVTHPGVPVVIDVLDGDYDPQGQLLEVVSVSEPSDGVAVIRADGQVQYLPSPSFSGDSFTYQVQDPWGNVDEGRVTVDPAPSPEARASWLCEGTYCLFSAATSTGVGLSYEWTFPGGIVRTGVEAGYDLASLGTHLVELEVTDSLGANDARSYDVVVADEVHEPPVAALVTRPLNEKYEFDASGSTDDVGIASYLLEVADYQLRLAPGTNVVSLPLEPGSWPVSVTVYDWAEQSDRLETTVVVNHGREE
jgi:hypothetical protein